MTASEGLSTQQPRIVITPSRGLAPLRLGELWQYRELLYFLVWREIKVRYKQTILGAAWAILQPVASALIFTVVFGRWLKAPSEGAPYLLFCCAAVVPWQFFAQSLTHCSRSVVDSARLIQKVYFPRALLPIAGVISGGLDFLLAFFVLVGLMICYGAAPGANLLLVAPAILWLMLVALGAGLWLSALNVQFRDVAYLVPFLTQFWFFCTPVVYPTSLVPERWRWLIGLNPLTGVVESFRAALLGLEPAPGPQMAISAAVGLALVLTGLVWFRRMERSFADAV